ncbi:glycosyltransferase [Cytobacillus depressus]|uniref:Glycosyltransferase n=1 Tax=Cytobacillus depressus TaxID=1602942 RepID=A0A6L3V8N4_9BACI|nr:glycosyltransferase family 2 protein [Cytobacillus depressus]KAB2336791.1 glycosyltransferase [Cytobacillus depressus]
MNNKTVSLCMIVKDEESYIKRCLDSVSNQVDEIIIVDTGSSDSTLCIAEDYGAKIFKFAWKEDFAEARNFSIEIAKSEYILVLDADEYLDQNTNLQEVLKELKDYYIINFKNYMDGGYITNHQAIRLFKNNLGLKYFGKIHEHLNIDDFDNLSIAFADFFIHHDGYKNEVFNQKNKFERNLKILEKEVKNNPTGYNLFNLGIQYKVGKEFLKALDQFKKSYSLSKNQIYLPFLLYSMGDCLLQLGRNREGIYLMKDSIELFPKYTGFYYLMGLFYEKQNYLKAAEKEFEKCLELGEVEHFQSIEGVGSYFAYIKLSEIQQKQGKLTAALDSAFSAVNQNKMFPPALNQYFSVMKSAGISDSNINDNLKMIYPIYEVKYLEILVKVFYVNRSQLLQLFIENYNLRVENSVLAIAALYNKKYIEACSIWMNEEKLDPEVLSDIISLCMIEKNKELFIKIQNTMNFDEREKKMMISLIERSDTMEALMSTFLFDIFKNSCLKLLILGEEKIFLNLYKNIKFTDDQKEHLISLLVVHGFLNIAGYLLEEEIKANKLNYHLDGLLVDVYIRQNKLNEALTMCTKLIEKTGDYSSYNRLFNLYEKINYEEEKLLVEQAMKQVLTVELA